MKRRNFLSTFAASSLALPVMPALAWSDDSDHFRSKNRALVLIELNGGNDGLNTVVPFNDPLYRRYRSKLALPKKTLIKIEDDLAWHPRLKALQKFFEQGQVAVINNVGYPKPSRSHFRSMDIWQSGIPDRVAAQTGWLGRAMAEHAKKKGSLSPEIFALGSGPVPLAFAGSPQSITALSKLEDLSPKGGQQQRDAVQGQLDKSASDSADLDFIQSAARGALDMGDRLKTAGKRLQDREDKFPKTPLGRELRLVSALLQSGFSNSVYHLRLSGFDTHALQAETHGALLGIFAAATEAFLNDLKRSGIEKDVTLVAFSEFGRRVAENASAGTDHGVAGPMIVAGAPVQGGIFGGPVDLEDLDRGDLKARVDFRSVFGRLAQDWMKLPVEKSFDPRMGPKFLT